MVAETLFPHVAILGAGAFGTALALHVDRTGRRVTLWTRHAATAASLLAAGENKIYLPGFPLPRAVAITAERADIQAADLVLMAVPAQHLRAQLMAARPHLAPQVPVVVCCKGIEKDSAELMDSVAASALPDHPVALLSGPSFADEVARGLPTAVTLAARETVMAHRIAAALHGESFRLYASTDMVGVAIGGALKNIIAIACGVVVGRKLGNNARAAVITRGLAEMIRYGRARGAHAETFMGLSGLGDLTLTCSSVQSRNMSLGVQLGQGQTLQEIMAARRTVAEGVATTAALIRHTEHLGLEMPIAMAVDSILHKNTGIDAAIHHLMRRPQKDEWS